MTSTFSFQCSKCEEIHEGIPSISLDAPSYYYHVPEHEREKRTTLNDNTCTVDDDYFAKGFLEIPVEGLDEPFSISAWISLSESNYYRYQESLSVRDAAHYGSMFGWFSSQIRGFSDCLSLKADLVLQDNNYRPDIIFEETLHPLSIAQRQGITQEKLKGIIEEYLHPEG